MKDNQNIDLIIRACREHKLDGQRKLYELYYSYGMSIALRYSANRGEGQDILNNAFYKVFTKIDQYDPAFPFKQWFRTILIHTSIDYARKYKKMGVLEELDEQHDPTAAGDSEEGYHNLVYEDLLNQIQKLPPAYKLVFNLYAIDGYKHHEIATKLGISVNTSKSNYSRARKQLQDLLKDSDNQENYKYGR
jgi:RNA polymerase sigma-70 factor (ECF subfamily)